MTSPPPRISVPQRWHHPWISCLGGIGFRIWHDYIVLWKRLYPVIRHHGANSDSNENSNSNPCITIIDPNGCHFALARKYALMVQNYSFDGINLYIILSHPSASVIVVAVLCQPQFIGEDKPIRRSRSRVDWKWWGRVGTLVRMV